MERRLLIKDALLAWEEEGRLVFSKQDLLALGFEKSSLQKALWRLQREKRLISPARDVFVIVHITYRSVGTPPPTWYLDAWMKARGTPYHLGLLSAAALHGASHQAVMETQVMVSAPIPHKIIASARFRFFVKHEIDKTPCLDLEVETGRVRLSTPAATFLDLIAYVKSVGSITTVLFELAENLTAEDLERCLKTIAFSVANLQRAGFYLEHFARSDLAAILAKKLQGKELHKVPLISARQCSDRKVHPVWKIIVNDDLEVDI